MTVYELTVIDAPYQRLETYLSDTAVALELLFNETTDRWSMNLQITGQTVLTGKRLVPGIDLFAPYQFGIGSLYLVDWEGLGGSPGRDALPSGQFRLWHVDGASEAA